jgi:hypothetical protein
MRIDSKQCIAGHLSMLIRKLLQRGFSYDWGAGLVEEMLAVGPEEANRVLAQLAEFGFIKPAAADPRGGPWWSNSVAGNALANATAAKPLRRPTADRALKEFRARVEAVNSDPYYLYGVTYAVVFGSYLSDSPTVNDVDLATELRPKESDRVVRKRLEDERVSSAIEAGRHFSNYLQEVRWPRTEVWLRLKARARALSLHDLGGDAEIIKKGRFEVLFSSDPDHPLPPVLQASEATRPPAMDAPTLLAAPPIIAISDELDRHVSDLQRLAPTSDAMRRPHAGELPTCPRRVASREPVTPPMLDPLQEG